MNALKQGILVTIEGIDGCGKSTILTNLVETLADLPTLFTQEPGGTPLGKHVRAIVQQQTTPLDPKTEFLLFAADRARHMYEIITPALAQKKIVISDRMADSSVVYQGYARGLDINMIKTINKWAMDSREPDLILFINIKPETAYKRIHKRKESLSTTEQQFWLEKEKLSFMQTVAHGYQELFKNRKNVITLDGVQSTERLAQEATAHIKNLLNQ